MQKNLPNFWALKKQRSTHDYVLIQNAFHRLQKSGGAGSLKKTPFINGWTTCLKATFVDVSLDTH